MFKSPSRIFLLQQLEELLESLSQLLSYWYNDHYTNIEFTQSDDMTQTTLPIIKEINTKVELLNSLKQTMNENNITIELDNKIDLSPFNLDKIVDLDQLKNINNNLGEIVLNNKNVLTEKISQINRSSSIAQDATLIDLCRQIAHLSKLQIKEQEEELIQKQTLEEELIQK